MSEPKERMLDEMRHCLHSQISCDRADLKPDYICTKNRMVCVLYRAPFCERYELFPEKYNT